MSRSGRIAVFLACTMVAPSLAAQDRGVVFQVDGGVFTHQKDLNEAGTAFLKTGYDLGGAIGLRFNRYFGINADFNYGRASGTGAPVLLDRDVHQYFLGGEAQLRYPIGQVTPFVLGGGGAVIVRPGGYGPNLPFDGFTRGGATFGAGIGYSPRHSPFELTATGKWLAYKWVASPFSRTQLDGSFALGLSYRLGF